MIAEVSSEISFCSVSTILQAQVRARQGSHRVADPLYAPSGGYNKNLLLLSTILQAQVRACARVRVCAYVSVRS